MKGCLSNIIIFGFLLLLFVALSGGGGGSGRKSRHRKGNGSYVRPYVTRRGHVVPGHMRKPYSTNPNVFRNRARSKYYHDTHSVKSKKK